MPMTRAKDNGIDKGYCKKEYDNITAYGKAIKDALIEEKLTLLFLPGYVHT